LKITHKLLALIANSLMVRKESRNYWSRRATSFFLLKI
jgi:hypothetical protein